MQNNPLISVVMTIYNREDYLEYAIQSVINQTYKNIEIIVVDDGSKTNYAERICSKYAQCRYYYRSNSGSSASRNFGVSKANGEFIAFLDDDDLFLPQKLEVQIALLQSKLDIDCVHSSALIIDGNGVPTGEIIGASEDKAHKRSGYVFWNALGTWVVKSPTPLFRRRVFDVVLFDESILGGEDLDFWWRVVYKFKVLYVKEPLAYYRENNNPNRLSKQYEKYLGLETKIYFNLKKMGIKNPFTLYRIALKLAQSGIRNINLFYGINKITISKWKLYLNPFFYVKNLNRLYC